MAKSGKTAISRNNATHQIACYRKTDEMPVKPTSQETKKAKMARGGHEFTNEIYKVYILNRKDSCPICHLVLE